MGDRLLTTEQASKYLNVHRNTILRWIENGKLPTIRVGKNYRIAKKDLQAQIKTKGPRIIAVANQKGGVAKTTTTLNIAAAIAAKGNRVLVVDLDPEGGCASSLGIDPGSLTKTLFNVLENDEVKAKDVIIATDSGIDLLPSNIDLSAAEVVLRQQLAAEQVFKFKLSLVQDNYDYIFLDCEPSLGLLTTSALTAAHSVLIPMETETLALRGLQNLLNTISRVRSYLNPELSILGIVVTKHKPRHLLNQEVLSALEEAAQKSKDLKLFNTVVKWSTRVAESPSAKKPIVLYNPEHYAAKAYSQIANEVIAAHV